ncbi:MAG: hypothetical protein Q4E47_02645 [Candidatus Saccharibacteria bacterium]|nr:hypothetical protein [Candidatus Saccharibacteria bacterium]
MIIIITLIALFALFMVVRKNIGVALLGAIAGVSVFEMFGKDLTTFITSNIQNVDSAMIEAIVYLVFVAGFPLVLYLRSSRGGLFGILRIAEAAIFAVLLALLCSKQIAYFCSFDDLAQNIMTNIENVKGWIMVGGIVSAYLDILVCRQV